MTIEEQSKEKLKEVKDPEFGKSIMERNLIDEVRVENDTAHILFHLAAPSAPMFLLYISGGR